MKNIILTSGGFRDEEFKNKFYEIIPKEELKTRLGKSLSCARHFSKCFIFTTYLALLGTIFIPILQMRYKEI